MKIGGKYFDTQNRTYIIGILNITPDSFSDGGKYNSVENALRRCEKMICEGADIIDIGGESTRPGYIRISDEAEMDRVVPVIKAVKDRFDIPVSIDTYKSKVARAALEAGADIINDIWGFKYDSAMAGLCAEYGAVCVLMHNSSNTDYYDLMGQVTEELRKSADIALKAGVNKENIIIDPGVGFGKTFSQNLEVIRELDRLKELGFPVLLGASRKSVIGLVLELPVEERLEGTLATSVIGVMKGVSFLRVHDVKENKRAVVMTEKVLGR